MSTRTLEAAIAASHDALNKIVNGDPGGYLALYAGEEEITLGNPFGPFAHGREEVGAGLSGAASNYKDGEVASVDLVANYLSEDFACVVEVENVSAKVGGGTDLVSVSLRVTSVFQYKGGEWRLVHRHADPITSARPARSVIKE